ncbi:hypothetical protein L914_11335 [Phytophthora nicotianae]|uniref:ZSWIM1/3 RNaseH-like domain-containing protein n=1 Tax=Phytophthora nicotianae TaxID=4792 RepID=W2N3J7_PHYNI|nr:hypothetical protein L914_11335 [Phytophthora nicotianae]
MSETSSPTNSSKHSANEWSAKDVNAQDSSNSEPDDLRVSAPPFQTWHDSWDEFSTSLSVYQEQTSQLYSIRAAVKATTTNQAFGDYNKKFIGTNGWNKSSRGQGHRTGHLERSFGCQVVLCATVMRCPATETFRSYPSNRRIADPDVIDLVDELIKAGGKPKKILRYLHETTGKCVTLRDVHNMVQRLKPKRHGSATVKDKVQTITLQTHQMRRFFEAFPEVVMLDSTRGTYSSKYKLFSLMIDDVFGHGQYVQHSLIQKESHACMLDAIGAFKENKPSWDRIRAIMIDKDFGEISLL